LLRLAIVDVPLANYLFDIKKCRSYEGAAKNTTSCPVGQEVTLHFACG
jgi:hypothetical protein